MGKRKQLVNYIVDLRYRESIWRELMLYKDKKEEKLYLKQAKKDNKKLGKRKKIDNKEIAITEEEKEPKLSRRGKVLRELIEDVTSNNLIGHKFKNGELRKKMVEPEWKCPKGYELALITMDNFTMEYLTQIGSTSEDVILQLHGGGYVGAMRNAYRSFAGLYSEVSRGNAVLTIDYRVAPEDPYPAALEDALCAYKWLLKNGYDGRYIIIGGDSAGGGLAMALCMYLKDHHIELPKAIIAMSPWTDLTASGESYKTNYEIDPLFGNTMDSLIFNKDYVGDADETDPYISPLYGDFTDFPPMLIQVGTYEMLLSDSTSVAKKALSAGVDVKLSVYEGMFHVFQMSMLMIPESKRAWKEVGRFIGGLK